MTQKIQALVGCQEPLCATEQSYHLDMVRLYDGQPICQVCYEDGGYGGGRWDDLPEITVENLCA